MPMGRASRLALTVLLLLPAAALANDVAFNGSVNPNCFTNGGQGTIEVRATNTLGHETDALVLAACVGPASAPDAPTWIVGETNQDPSDPLKLPTVFTYLFNDQNCIRADPAGPGGTWPVNTTENVTFTYQVPAAFAQGNLLIHYTAFSAEAPHDKGITVPRCGEPSKKPHLRIEKSSWFLGGRRDVLSYRLAIWNDGQAPTAGDITIEDVVPNKLKIVLAFLTGVDGGRVPIVPSGQLIRTKITSSLPPASSPADVRFVEIWVEAKSGATSGDLYNSGFVCGGGDPTAPCSDARESNVEKNSLLIKPWEAPVITMEGPLHPFAGLPVTYAAAESNPLRTVGGQSGAVDHAWVLSDVPAVPAAAGSTMVHTFAKPGKHTVTLITFGDGGHATIKKTIDVAPAAAGCAADATTLCLLGGRFKVQVDWQALTNSTNGAGNARGITSDTGAFWFFNAANLELLVKLVDGRGLNGKFWVFFAALSDVQYQIKITDTQTGEVRQYLNHQGDLTSFADTSAFPLASSASAAFAETAAEEPLLLPLGDEIEALPASACLADPATRKLCLADRFDVSVTCSAPGTACTPNPVKLTDDTGYFWFFNSANLELMTKIVDGRGLNGKFWFFYGALSDVQYKIRVTDRTNGNFKEYTNPQGRLSSVADTGALPGQ